MTLSNTKSPPITDKWAGLVWAELRKKLPDHDFSFASRYLRYIRTLLAFGRESDPNSNCSSLAWPASCPSSSYPRRRDERISAMRSRGRLTQQVRRRCVQTTKYKNTGTLVTEVNRFSWLYILCKIFYYREAIL